MKTLVSTKPVDQEIEPRKMKNTVYWLVIISAALFLFKITQDIPVTATINAINP